MHGRVWKHWHCRSSLLQAYRVAVCLPLFCGLLTSSCRAENPVGDTVQVEVRHVGFDRFSNSPVVILQDKEKKKSMPIWVGAFEAQAIALELQGIPPPRPLTHDLLKNILEQAGVQFEKVVVSELKENTYYAQIYLAAAGKPFAVDSRPSDAIALALRFHRPIFVAKELFDLSFPSGPLEEQVASASEKISGVTVQDLTDELAAHFNLPDTQGVLVADSGRAGGEDQLQRGDVIMAVGEETVRNVADFRDKVKKEKGGRTLLRVQRDGKERGVYWTPAEE
jgi:bifunctional DNase/RNase